MLKHPETEQVARCVGVAIWTWAGAYRMGEQDHCIRDYEIAGFKRVN